MGMQGMGIEEIVIWLPCTWEGEFGILTEALEGAWVAIYLGWAFCKLGQHHTVDYLQHIEGRVHKNSTYVVHNGHNYSNFRSLSRRTKAGEVTIQGSGIDDLCASL